MSLSCVNVEKSAGLFKTLILIHWFHSPKRNKNIRWTLWWLGLFFFSKNALCFWKFKVLHLWTAIFRFHHPDHLLFASGFGYRGAVVGWIVISGCFHAGHLIIINCLWWVTFIFIWRTWLASAILPLFIMISWTWKIWILELVFLFRTRRKSTSLTVWWRCSRDLKLIKLLLATNIRGFLGFTYLCRLFIKGFFN